MLGNTWQNAAIGLGIGCSIVYGILLSNVPVVKKIEDRINDSLILMNSAKKTDKIALINIPAEKQRLLKPDFYADLSERLLKENAAVVVLNFPNGWETIIGGEERFVKLVQQHSDRLVLVVRTAAVNSHKPNPLHIYNGLLPFNDDVRPEVDIAQIQGFSEYDYDSKNYAVPVSPARKIQSEGTFLRSDDKTPIKLKSAPLLALYKYNKLNNNQETTTSSRPSGQINFTGITNTFTNTDIDELCFTGTFIGSPAQCIPPNSKQGQKQKQKFYIYLL